MTQAYKLLTDSAIEPLATKGTTVYRCRMYDYGCASDDTRYTGVEHVSMTLDPNGDYPFFTHPWGDLEEIHDAK